MRRRSSTLSYLDELGGPKPTHPQETALRWGLPYSIQEVEYIRLSNDGFQPEEIIIVPDAVIYDHTKIVVRKVSLKCSSEVRHDLAVIIQPSTVLHVKNRSACSAQALGNSKQREVAIPLIAATEMTTFFFYYYYERRVEIDGWKCGSLPELIAALPPATPKRRP